MKALLRWWIIFCLSLLAGGVAVYFDLHQNLYDGDQTKISFLILGVFGITTAWIGKETVEFGRYGVSRSTEIGWFVAESCLALGMIGTVIGFLYMLGQTFVGIDVTNASTLQNALMIMAQGMSTALYTTLIGLISSLLIKIQLVNLEAGQENEVT